MLRSLWSTSYRIQGDIGTDKRLELNVVGDPVNIASRVQRSRRKGRRAIVDAVGRTKRYRVFALPAIRTARLPARGPSVGGDSGGKAGMEDSIRPSIAEGLSDLVDKSHRVTDEVWLESTPGHTPGHFSIRIPSAGENAATTGGRMHHPVQCKTPSGTTPSTYDGPLRSGPARFLRALRRQRRARLRRALRDALRGQDREPERIVPVRRRELCASRPRCRKATSASATTTPASIS